MIKFYKYILANDETPAWIRESTEQDLKEVTIDIISVDHDAGDFYHDGGDFICVLDWLEQTGRNYPIHLHSANAVGVANMRRIIEKNGWKEIR